MSAVDEVRGVRDALQEALLHLDRSRTPETGDLTRISELWQSMNDGRWPIVEHFDRDGHRYLLVHRDLAGSESVSLLSSRELQVLTRANRGLSNKLIAHDLDLSASAVSTYLARARKKLDACQSLFLGRLLLAE